MKRPDRGDYNYVIYPYTKDLEQYCDDSDRIRKDQAGLIIRKQKQVDDLKKENEKLKKLNTKNGKFICSQRKENEKLRKALVAIEALIDGEDSKQEAIWRIAYSKLKNKS